MKRYIILASKSKRRQKIFSSCGIRYKVITSNIKEHLHQDLDIPHLVMLNAKKKAEYAAKLSGKDDIILGADTLVSINGRTIGKPKGKKDAMRILKASSGKDIIVYTGLYLVDKRKNLHAQCCDKSDIKVKKINPKDINRYFKLLKPYDKAGAFSIEGAGAIIFDDIKGSYFNILGLPMGRLDALFKKIGLNLLDFVRRV